MAKLPRDIAIGPNDAREHDYFYHTRTTIGAHVNTVHIETRYLDRKALPSPSTNSIKAGSILPSYSTL